MFVSVIVPCYKQEKTIIKDINNIAKALSQTRWDYEIIVVDDGSPDKTYHKAQQISAEKIKVVGYETNKGKGYAVKYGMARAKGDIIAFIDSGMDINPNSISLLIEHMIWYDSDVIVGSKRHSVSKVTFNLVRRIYSFGYYTLVRLLFGLKVRDTQTGVKVFKRKVLEKVLPRMLVKRFAFDIELLAVAHRLGFTKIHEGPVELKLEFSENSKFKLYAPLFLDRQIRLMLQDTIAVFYRLKILKYYDNGNKRKWVYDKELDMKINTGL